jgi:hypothetical protein
MSNELKRKIISDTVQRLIGQLSLEDLAAIYEAEQDAWHASAQLGISSQIAAQDYARTVTREIIAGLDDYSIDRMEQNLKVSARDLAKYTAEVAA